MTETLDQANAALRAAVTGRLTTTDEQRESYAEWTPPEFAKLRPGSAAFIKVLDEVRAMHVRKTLDYGCDEDAFANIRNSADIINVPPFVGCFLRMADKMQRLRAFMRRGHVEFDGVEDTLLDFAAYSAIALVMYREHVAKERAE